MLATKSIRVKDKWKIQKRVNLSKGLCEPIYIGSYMVGMKFLQNEKEHIIYLASNGNPNSIKEIRLNVNRENDALSDKSFNDFQIMDVSSQKRLRNRNFIDENIYKF